MSRSIGPGVVPGIGHSTTTGHSPGNSIGQGSTQSIGKSSGPGINRHSNRKLSSSLSIRQDDPSLRVALHETDHSLEESPEDLHSQIKSLQTQLESAKETIALQTRKWEKLKENVKKKRESKDIEVVTTNSQSEALGSPLNESPSGHSSMYYSVNQSRFG